MRIAQVLVYTGVPISWEAANRKCTILGDGWRLTRGDNNRTSTFASYLGGGAKLPIAHVQASNSQFGYWADGAADPSNRYMNWRQNYPQLSGNCTLLDSALSPSATWQDVDCLAATFTMAVCEKEDDIFYGSATHIVLDNYNLNTRHPDANVSNPFPIGVLPTDLSTWVYGATLHQSWDQCYDQDRFWFTAIDDRVQMTFYTKCQTMIARVAPPQPMRA